MTKTFDIGEWVEYEDGYGQILYVRPKYFEIYDKAFYKGKVGDFISMYYICKTLCGFTGKVKKRNRITLQTSINRISDKGKQILEELKTNNSLEYENYIIFDDKVNIHDQIFLNYYFPHSRFNEVKEKLTKIYNSLYPCFTFKELVSESKKENFPFDLKNVIPLHHGFSDNEKISLRLDSDLYKVKNKQSIFNNYRVFAVKNGKIIH